MYSNPNYAKSVSAKARSQRARMCAQFLSKCGIAGATVLDLGGTVDYWKMNLNQFPDGMIKEIDIVNLPPQKNRKETIDNVLLHVYEGNALERSTLRLNHYDFVHSNSVIEHVGNLHMQCVMARIIENVGTYYWVQTPAKSFPVEPHFYFPFFAYLPLGIRTILHRRINLGFMCKESNWINARITCEQTRLLTKSELEAIFPGARIIRERFFLMTKSYIAMNMADTQLQVAPHRTRYSEAAALEVES